MSDQNGRLGRVFNWLLALTAVGGIAWLVSTQPVIKRPSVLQHNVVSSGFSL